jgi:hypothetical protein
MMCNSVKPKPPTQYSIIAGSIKVKTVFERPPAKQVNIKDLDSSKVASLKTSGPFLYYSIPTISQAAMLNQDVDIATFDKSSHFSKNQKTSEEKATMITRKSRLSFESHLDLHFACSMINSADCAHQDSDCQDYLYE